MSQDERRTIGLDRPIHLEWMDAAAGSLADGRSPKEARDFVWKLLDGAVAGKTAQSARGKTLTVISRVWLTVPAAARPLRDSALKVIAHASADDRLALHWALLSATYPFFLDVASQVGRLLSLNSDFSVGQLTRRVVEAWGDRSTLRPAIQRLVRSMSGWGVLALLIFFILVLRFMHRLRPIERVLVFPMALVPNLWGLWNMLFIASHSRTHLPIGLHGALLPFVLAPLGILLLHVLDFPALPLFAHIFPIAAPIGLIAYYLVWKYLVHFLNAVLGIA